MQKDYGESEELIDVNYVSVLSELEDKDSIDDEIDIVDSPNLESELSEIEIDSSSYLTNEDNFFKLEDSDLVEGSLSDKDLYSSEPLAVIGKSKLVDMTADTVKQTATHMHNIIESLATLTGMNKDHFEDMTEVKKYVDSVDKDCPDFVNSTVQGEVLRFIYKNMSGEEIFDLCSISASDKNNEAKKYLFINWINHLYKDLDDFRKSSQHSSSVNRKSQEVLLKKLFSGINIADSYSALIKSSNRDVYTTFYTDGSKVSHFKCNNCSSEDEPYLSPLQEDFIVITNINNKPGFIVTPSICDKCGTFHLLSPTTLKDFSSKCRSIGSGLTAGSTNYNGLRIATYKPSFIEIGNLLSIYYDIDLIPGMSEDNLNHDSNITKEVKEIIYDWDSICKEFRELNTMIGDSIFKLNNKEESLSNITKVVANQLDSYPRLKENALASLILTLEKEGLFKFSLESKCYYEVYSKINDLSKVTPTAIKNLSDVFYYKLINDDDSINYQLADEVFNNIRDNYSTLENDKLNFLSSLESSKYFLSYIPISKIDLREDMIYNYLSDPLISKLLNEISDLMILNYLSEDLFETLRFHKVKDQIKSVNRKKSLSEYVSRLSKFFGYQSHTILNFLDDPDSINNLSSFLDACYREDLYDMYKFKENIGFLDASSCNEEIKKLFEFIMIFPNQELKGDKFSFYFNFNCDINYKARFVKMYETKGFVPEELLGETVDEKLKYYSNCDRSTSKDLIPSGLRKLLNNYSDVIKFGRFISYMGMYRDFGSYYAMRDILFESQNYSIENLLNALSIEPIVSSLLLDEDYESPSIDRDIVKDYIYLVLPIFSPDLEDKQNDTTKSYRERINDVIDNIESLISQYKGLDELETLLSNLIKDLMNRGK